MCALLAPVVASAVAFQWSLPEPTVYIAAVDASWTPVPTAAPQLPSFKLSRRQDDSGDNTCAFLSGLSQSSITCQDTAAICATNTYLGVHGCCNPDALSSCVIPTTCIPSTAMPASCTDAACTSNAAIAKCTAASSHQCYQFLIQYSNTVMTQHGCTLSALTLTAQRSWGVIKSSSYATPSIVTVTQIPPSTPTPTSSQLVSPNKAPTNNIGIIVGCTIGGALFFSIIALIALLVHRRRTLAYQNQDKRTSTSDAAPPASHPVTQYDAVSAPSACSEADGQVWQGLSPATTLVPVYPGMGSERMGVVEVDGTDRLVEAPGWTGDGD